MISVSDTHIALPKYENLRQCIVPKTLHLTRRNKFKTLRASQRYRSIVIRKPGGHKYKFDFELSMNDAASTPMYLYQKTLDALPKRTVFLWVCTISKPYLPSPQIVKVSDIDWHFSVVETTKELTCKHKGIMSKLKHNDLLLSAGEMYLTDDRHVQWNNQTGCLKRSMFSNEKRLGKPFIDAVLLPILNHFPYQFEFNLHLLHMYAPKITYDYCNTYYKRNTLNRVTKHRVRSSNSSNSGSGPSTSGNNNNKRSNLLDKH